MTSLPLSPTAMSRLSSIQSLRGVAALMVVLAHALGSAGHVTGQMYGMISAIAPLGAAGVDLFFIISGFVMALGINQKSQSTRDFARTRFFRIAPLFWLLSILYACLWPPKLGPGDVAMIYNTITIIPLFDGAVFHQPILYVGWTLAFELAFYALVALVLFQEMTGDRQLNILTGLVFCAAVIGVFWQPTWASARILFNPMMLEFLFGIVVYQLWRSGNWVARAPIMMVVGIALLAVVLLNPLGLDVSLNDMAVIQNGEGLSRALVLGLPCAFIFAGVVLEAPRPQLFGGLFGILGDASYSIYLTHIFIGQFVMKAVSMNLLDSYFSVAGLMIGGSIISGIAVHRTIEKPLIEYFRPKHRVQSDPAPAS